MKTSEQINELAAALAKAQAGFEAAGRDHKAKVETKTGGSYEFSYADFAAYLDVCRKPLAENGLAFIQEATRAADQVAVTTRLMHGSGQWIETEPLTLPLIPDSRGALTAQIVGSGVTYAKRYSLSSLIGLASEADDDGNAASGNDASVSKRPAMPVCPKCNENTAVIVGKPEYGGGFVCFGKKGGCGWKWQLPEGVTTADKIPPPAEKTVYQRALEEITKAVQNHDKEHLRKVAAKAHERKAEGKLTESEDAALLHEISLAETKIEKLLNQPEAAA